MTPTILVLLGATGDLTAKKIAPALYYLYSKNQLPKLFSVVGFARSRMSNNDFQKHIREVIAKQMRVNKSSIEDDFINKFSYQHGLFENMSDYKAMGNMLGLVDDSWRTCANKLFYLAVPPQYYETIFNHLAHSGLTRPCSDTQGWTRVIVEKPFGKNFETARKLDELLAKLFKEEQIYRIDHYLAKEMLQGIMHFRFSNNLLEQSWGNHGIEKIELTLLETLGVEDRGTFYDGVGALRDVGQNHLLQMLALITMDAPAIQPDSLRQKRAEVLEALKPFSVLDVRHNSIRGQYQGYQDIQGVGENSKTETYFKLHANLSHPRWMGVPITIEAGKGFKEIKKEIVVTFKHPEPCYQCPPGRHFQNKVVFTLDPMETIKIQFLTKKPGFESALERRYFNFMLYEKNQKTQYVEEYAKLLLDCVKGDQTLFVSSREVKAMWRFIDSIINGWQKNLTPLLSYKKGEAEIMEQLAITASSQVNQELNKKIGIIGLGKMGSNMSERLMELGWQVTGYDANYEDTKKLAKKGVITTFSIDEFLAETKTPRIIWLMVSASGVDGLISKLAPKLNSGDTIIDGGNSHFKDAPRRAKLLAKKGINFVDVGVSGGPTGALNGACLMVGGKTRDFERLLPLYIDLAATESAQHFPGYGAGHYVKMIHNGIEYGIMQSIAEGFGILKKAPYKIDLSRAAQIYNRNSVIESKLINWLIQAFNKRGQNLSGISGVIGHTGEAKWTVAEAKRLKLPSEVIESSLKFRLASAKKPSFTSKIVSALREQFGGHKVK